MKGRQYLFNMQARPVEEPPPNGKITLPLLLNRDQQRAALLPCISAGNQYLVLFVEILISKREEDYVAPGLRCNLPPSQREDSFFILLEPKKDKVFLSHAGGLRLTQACDYPLAALS